MEITKESTRALQTSKDAHVSTQHQSIKKNYKHNNQRKYINFLIIQS